MKNFFLLLFVSGYGVATQTGYQRAADQAEGAASVELQTLGSVTDEPPVVPLDESVLASSNNNNTLSEGSASSEKMDELVIYIGSHRARQVIEDTFHVGGTEEFKKMIHAIDGLHEEVGCSCLPWVKRKKVSAQKVLEKNKEYLSLYEKIENNAAARKGSVERINVPTDSLGVLLFLSLKKDECHINDWADIQKSDLVSWIKTKKDYDSTHRKLESQNPRPAQPFYLAPTGHGFSFNDLVRNYASRH